MKLYFYRGSEPNFGDELNPWLLPRVFPGLFDDEPHRLFLGIGSIINDRYDQHVEKIVFGSGYGAYRGLPTIDSKWKIYCVRGYQTARALKLTDDFVAADPAILIHRFASEIESSGKRFDVSFVPHWESMRRGNWQAACEHSGVHCIDPRRPVPEVLSEIVASNVIIAEAMHAAIVADALRVPWIPVLPFHQSHHYKWKDWAGTLDLCLSPQSLAGSSLLETRLIRTGHESARLCNATGILRRAISVSDLIFIRSAARSLREVRKVTPILSSDKSLARALAKLDSAAARVRADFRLTA
jgi:hypothetical protein